MVDRSTYANCHAHSGGGTACLSADKYAIMSARVTVGPFDLLGLRLAVELRPPSTTAITPSLVTVASTSAGDVTSTFFSSFFPQSLFACDLGRSRRRYMQSVSCPQSARGGSPQAPLYPPPRPVPKKWLRTKEITKEKSLCQRKNIGERDQSPRISRRCHEGGLGRKGGCSSLTPSSSTVPRTSSSTCAPTPKICSPRFPQPGHSSHIRSPMTPLCARHHLISMVMSGPALLNAAIAFAPEARRSGQSWLPRRHSPDCSLGVREGHDPLQDWLSSRRRLQRPYQGHTLHVIGFLVVARVCLDAYEG